MDDEGYPDFNDHESYCIAREMEQEAQSDSLQEYVNSLSPDTRDAKEFMYYACHRNIEDLIKFRKNPSNLNEDLITKEWEKLSPVWKDTITKFLLNNFFTIEVHMTETVLILDDCVRQGGIPYLKSDEVNDVYNMIAIEIGCQKCNLLLPGHDISSTSMTFSTIHHTIVNHLEDLKALSPDTPAECLEEVHEILKEHGKKTRRE